MKNTFLLLLPLFFLIFMINAISAPFDTGIITFNQPDETEFVGRFWGDEFIYWGETEGGYRFLQTGDGWYYYAQLDETGEFAPTEYKVGIDEPPAESYQLERTQERMEEIAILIEQQNEQILENREWFRQKQAEADLLGLPVNINIGVILIEFTDQPNYTDQTYPEGYHTSFFDSMMFSQNYWYAPDLQTPSPHPEEELVFGSFRDYWEQMSLGNLIITGKVVNKTINNIPEWIFAPQPRSYYLTSAGHMDLPEDAIQTAQDSGLINEIFDKYYVIYAGDAATSYYARGWNNGLYFYDAERSGPSGNGGTQSQKAFTHIGVPAHEFAHTIGLLDEYSGVMEFSNISYGEDGGTSLYNFDLMADGEHSGPDSKGACPATLSPYYRIMDPYGWVTPFVIDSLIVNLICNYDYSEPVLYKLTPINAAEDEHYIFESRGREGFDLYIPSDPDDTVNQPGNLIIWQHNTSRPSFGGIYHDRIRIKSADTVSNSSTQINDFFPGNFAFNNYQSFNCTTSPCTSVRDFPPNIPYNTILGHFELNGIQKLFNNNTFIEKVIPYHPSDTLLISSGWQTVSVPVEMINDSAKIVFGTNTVYKFSGSYQQVHTL